MAQMIGTDDIESLRIELAEIGRSLTSSFRRLSASSFRSNASAKDGHDDLDQQHAIQWSQIERLPTFERLRSSLFEGHHDDDDDHNGGKAKRVVDVTKLGAQERHLFIERLIKHIESDNLRLLNKIRGRIDK